MLISPRFDEDSLVAYDQTCDRVVTASAAPLFRFAERDHLSWCGAPDPLPELEHILSGVVTDHVLLDIVIREGAWSVRRLHLRQAASTWISVAETRQNREPTPLDAVSSATNAMTMMQDPISAPSGIDCAISEATPRNEVCR